MEITVLRQGSELDDGRYVLERRLGAGGMATVWLAEDTRLQRYVAIKIPSEALNADPTFARRFEREARTAAALSHPNLVSVYDYGCEGKRPYLVSEFIDGASLAQLRERGEAPGVEALSEALLGALGHIHSSGIVHRDIKPGNVLVEPSERILLTDFGIAQSTEETRLTKSGHVIGTYDYLAPEVRRGDRATPSSDLYSCGVVLSEGLREEDPDRFHRLVRRLTAPDPRQRPAGAEAALELLDPPRDATTAAIPMDIGATVEQPARPQAPMPPPPPPSRPAPVRSPRNVLEQSRRVAPGPTVPPPAPRRSFPVVPALALLVVAGLAAAVIVLSSGGDDAPERSRVVAKGAGAAAEAPAEAETEATAPEETTPTTTTEGPVAAAEPDIERGVELNDQGYALIQQGDFAGALPILEESVSLFPEDSTDINYAYALFNYAQALRETGDPAGAIPLLERRLSFSDNQVDVVEAELALAREQAGEG